MEEQDQEKRKYSRIGKVTGVLLVCVAIFYDLSEFSVEWFSYIGLVGLGEVLAAGVDLVAIMHFSLWFTLLGVYLASPKVVARYWICLLGDLILPIPGIDIFLTTLGVVLTIKMIRTEDMLGINVINKIPGNPLKKGAKKAISKKTFKRYRAKKLAARNITENK